VNSDFVLLERRHPMDGVFVITAVNTIIIALLILLLT
jgi:hypothetical protein